MGLCETLYCEGRTCSPHRSKGRYIQEYLQKSLQLSLTAHKSFGWIAGYKAASAKKWDDEHMRKMFNAGMERGYWMYGGESEYHDGDPVLEQNAPNFDTYFNHLQPKIKSIEIEMDTEYYVNNEWKSVLLPSEWDDSNPTRQVPMTYQKNGKTFLKIKQINYV